MFEKHLWKSNIFSKNQLPGFYISRILVEYGLMIKEHQNLIELKQFDL